MKPKLLLVAAIVAACSMTSCSKTELDNPAKANGKGIRITITATTEDNRGPKTKLGYTEETGTDGKVIGMKVIWKNRDSETPEKLFVFIGDEVENPVEFTLTGGDGTETGTFSGTIPEDTPLGTPLHAVYSGSIYGSGGWIAIAQDATQTPEELANNEVHLMYATATWQGTSAPAPKFSFRHKMALIKLDLNLPAGASNPDMISITGPEVSNYSRFNVTTGSYDTKVSSGAIYSLGNFTLDGTKLTAYMLMFPDDVVDGNMFISSGNKVYTLTNTFSSTSKVLEAGKMYTITRGAGDFTTLSADGFAGGSGTSDSPYQIATAEQMKLLSTLTNYSYSYFSSLHYFELTNDIDLSTVCGPSVNGKEVSWSSIGAETIVGIGNTFNGSFDGNGYTISGLYGSNEYSTSSLFGVIWNARISNLTLLEPNITSSYPEIGAIAARISNSMITGCKVSGGSIQFKQGVFQDEGNSYIGGITGYIYNSAVVACISEGCSFSSTSDENLENYQGGISGRMVGSNVIACVGASTSFSGNGVAGGIVGRREAGPGQTEAGPVISCFWLKDATHGTGTQNGIGFNYDTNGALDTDHNNVTMTKATIAEINSVVGSRSSPAEGTMNKAIADWNALAEGGNNDPTSIYYTRFQFFPGNPATVMPLLKLTDN